MTDTPFKPEYLKEFSIEVSPITSRTNIIISSNELPPPTLPNSVISSSPHATQFTWLALSSIALSGSYYDLIDRPILSAVALSGDYNDLINLPVFPSFSNVARSGDYNDLLNKPILPTLHNVALTGDYNDLSNAPLLHIVALSGDYNDLENRPDLNFHPVAYSGDYKDLANVPDFYYQRFKELQTENFTVSNADHGLWIPCGGQDITITLPLNVSPGLIVYIQRQDTFTVTFYGEDNFLISVNNQIAYQFGVALCVFDGANWRLSGDLLPNSI